MFSDRDDDQARGRRLDRELERKVICTCGPSIVTEYFSSLIIVEITQFIRRNLQQYKENISDLFFCVFFFKQRDEK